MKRIYAYYESIPTIDQRDEFAVEGVWRRSWKEAGWDPQILNKSHGSYNPNMQKLMSKIHKESLAWPAELQNQAPKLRARLARWAALEAAGGGWMSDYDVANLGFTPDIAEDLELKQGLLVTGPESAYVFYASPALIKAALSRLINEPLIDGNRIKHEHEILNSHYFSTQKLHHATRPNRVSNLESVLSNPPKIKSKAKITIKPPKALE
jgi:hypothetical protein